MIHPNPEMQAILEVLQDMHPLPIEHLTPEQARLMPLPDQAALAYYGQHVLKRTFSPMPPPLERIEHFLVPGAETELVVRLYAPKTETPKGGWPIVLYFHGGGWVIANLNTYDGSCRALSLGADCMVISVHCRQAPENPWPAAANDAFAAYQWVLSNAVSFGGDISRVAVAGESAGGNLAAVVSLMARDKGVKSPLHQLLVYPVTDLVNGPTNISAIEHDDAKPLNRAMLNWFYDLYAPEGVNRTDPYLSPIFAASLSGLPPATVILAEIDPLRTDGENYAAKLAEFQVPVTLKIYRGVTHEFFGLAGLVPESSEAVALACENLKAAFQK